MLRNILSEKRFRNGFDTTPRRRNSEAEEVSFNDRNWALLGLIFSFTVIFVKIFFEHYDTLEKLIFQSKLVSYEVVTESGQIMFTNTWETTVKYSNFWLPLACGFLATYFTWMCVYLDSNVPGVSPPSPLSPQKYRVQSGHTFHLNYLFAVFVGFLVTSYMYYREYSV